MSNTVASTQINTQAAPGPLSVQELAKIARKYPLAVRKALDFAGMLEKGILTVQMPDGVQMQFGGNGAGPRAEMQIRDFGFARRLATGGELGIAEAYINGEWDTPDLTSFLAMFCANKFVLGKLLADKPIIRLLQLARHWLNRNTKAGARRNIHAHYDLGNAFYAAWLDPSMTYSSALFTGNETNLEHAQTAKNAALAQSIGLSGDKHVLEIGCGWGGFAEFAAKTYGCQVTGLTISQEQFDFAKQRIFRAGLSEKVNLKLQDYRDERGQYDAIASIEMLEAVGEAFWPTYFTQLHDRLTPQGLAGVQTITIAEDNFQSYRREIDFIRRYIFPGGMLPTARILQEQGSRHGLRMVHQRAFGKDYAVTLATWRDRFLAAWPSLSGLGFDEKFRRMWEYYLCYCEAGFAMEMIDVRQVIYARD
ncbi:MAG: cyclopropane-fatty-acyl-phospholipid synthase family protein [Hyphomicrobiales bacterium]|nr:cyclopropane-fatty-acyl-phospholipid synthase family protein [Hyphomicrobiales bacterium]MDE2113965.1 class I SAM-dependent methyltransferase [Hyphomicrobiales bacterium]